MSKTGAGYLDPFSQREKGKQEGSAGSLCRKPGGSARSDPGNNKAWLVFERSPSLLLWQAGHLIVSDLGLRMLGDSGSLPLRLFPYEIRPFLECEHGFNASGNEPSQ